MALVNPIGLSEPEPPPQADGNGRPSPMLEQYIEITAANPDCLLCYRMGDFY
jgi:DNA mismatch repair protein MutS